MGNKEGSLIPRAYLSSNPPCRHISSVTLSKTLALSEPQLFQQSIGNNWHTELQCQTLDPGLLISSPEFSPL